MKQNEYDAATSMQQLVEARPFNRRGRAILSSVSAELLSADPNASPAPRALRLCVCLPARQVWTPKANARQRRGRAGRVQARSRARSGGGV
jgi:hypothetical protein